MSKSMGINNESVVRGTELRLDTVIAGLASALPASTTSLMIGRSSMAVADVVKLATALEKPWKDVRAAHAVIRGAMAHRLQDQDAARTFLAELQAALIGVFGRDSQELVKFGFVPHRPRRKHVKPDATAPTTPGATTPGALAPTTAAPSTATHAA